MNSFFVCCILVLTFLVFTSCDKEKLSAPEGLSADFFEAFWEPVENADEYSVFIDGIECQTTEPSFSLFEYASPGESYCIEVIAKGAGYENSNAATVQYTVEDVTPNLRYTVNESNDTCKVACPVESIPENGELVLPDEYDGHIVTVFETAEIDTLISSDSPGIVGDLEYKGASYEKITKVRLPANLKKMDKGALYKSQVNDVYIPETVEEVAGFTECKNLTKITLPENLKAVGRYAFYNCTSLEEIEIPATVRDIWFYAFFGCESLREITIPEGVTRITRKSFYNCKSLTRIEIPEGVTNIEPYAFYGCENLTEVDAPNSIQEVGEKSFDNTKIYNDHPDGIVFIDNILYACKGEIPAESEIQISDTVRAIADNAVFKNQINLVSITLPDGLKRLPDETFLGCKNLVSVSLGGGIYSIGKSVFKNCESLQSFNIPDGVTLIAESAFSGCTSITEAVIPGSVMAIGTFAFAHCKSLADVKLREGLEYIDSYAFAGCSSLEVLDIPKSVIRLYFDCITETKVSHLDLTGSVSIFGGKVDNLVSVFISKDENRLKYADFYLCSNINTFYYGGTEEDWEQIDIYRQISSITMMDQETIDKENAKIAEWESKLTVYFYSEEAPTEEGNFWHYVDGTPTKW